MMSETEGQPVAYAKPGPAAAGFQQSRSCALPLDIVVERLRAAIEAAGLWVLHEVNPQQLLARGGYAIGPARQILFFHPRFVVRMLQADPTALPEAPLKIAAMQMPDGATTIRWFDPEPNFARYGNAELTELGRELAGLCETIAAAALQSSHDEENLDEALEESFPASDPPSTGSSN